MQNQKFSDFKIGQPLLIYYNDSSFYILQKITKSQAKVICVDKRENPILEGIQVGIIITNIPANKTYGVILPIK